jgi:hypothetical protein
MIDIKSVDKWAEKIFEAAQKHTRHPKPDGVVHFKYKTYQEFKNSNECFIENKTIPVDEQIANEFNNK